MGGYHRTHWRNPPQPLAPFGRGQLAEGQGSGRLRRPAFGLNPVTLSPSRQRHCMANPYPTYPERSSGAPAPQRPLLLPRCPAAARRPIRPLARHRTLVPQSTNQGGTDAIQSQPDF